MDTSSRMVALVFPGQGSQSVGMGQSLAENFSIAKDTFLEAENILEKPITHLMWNGPEAELNDTISTQPALFVHSIAAYRVFQLNEAKIVPMFFAGHSLGQISAAVAAGALSFSDGVKLVKRRGELMKRAGELNPGGMAAILGLGIPELDEVCRIASKEDEIVQVANDNCPGQVVLSGHKAALERAIVGAKAAGAKRALPLAVSIAAHSPLMANIQVEWDEMLNSIPFTDIKIPVVGNVSAAPKLIASEIRDEISLQMQSRVRWTETIKLIGSSGVTTFIEVGTGSVLGGLVKRILDNVTTVSLGNSADFAALDK